MAFSAVARDRRRTERPGPLGVELDCGYVDTTVPRWQALTGGSALNTLSGRSFDDLAREAEMAHAG